MQVNIINIGILIDVMNTFKELPCIYCEGHCFDTECEEQCLFFQAWKELVEERERNKKVIVKDIHEWNREK